MKDRKEAKRKKSVREREGEREREREREFFLLLLLFACIGFLVQTLEHEDSSHGKKARVSILLTHHCGGMFLSVSRFGLGDVQLINVWTLVNGMQDDFLNLLQQ